MVFSSLVFLCLFFPLHMLVYYLAKGIEARNTVLILFSLVFYAWGEPFFIVLLLFMCFVDWAVSQGIYKYRGTGKSKAFLVLGCFIDLGLLAFFKYTVFILTETQSWFGFPSVVPKIALPIGISFYTFQTMSYTIDVYRQSAPVQRNVITFGAYVTLFPQLIPGPIIQYKTVAEQLVSRTENLEKFVSGVRRFIVGLAKKVLLANAIGELWDQALASQSLTVAGAWLGLAAYAFQIYFDFSGYSDMAIGLGRMLGFEFIENFNYPYISRSVVDFWKRWHISLTTWFREYLYFPLGGNRVPRWKWVRNILIVWLLTGLWHGAGWNFLLWGLYYALFMLAERLFLGKWLETLPRALQHVYALFVVLIGWALFAVEDMGRLGAYLSACFGGAPLASAADGYYLMSYLPLLLILAVAATPLGKRLWDRAGERAHGVLLPVLTLAGLVLCTASLVDASYNPFLYFRF